MYTDDDIGKTVTDKNGNKVLVAHGPGDDCGGCFYDTFIGDPHPCDPVRDADGHIGCRTYDLIFEEVPE